MGLPAPLEPWRQAACCRGAEPRPAGRSAAAVPRLVGGAASWRQPPGLRRRLESAGHTVSWMSTQMSELVALGVPFLRKAEVDTCLVLDLVVFAQVISFALGLDLQVDCQPVASIFKRKQAYAAICAPFCLAYPRLRSSGTWGLTTFLCGRGKISLSPAVRCR